MEAVSHTDLDVDDEVTKWDKAGVSLNSCVSPIIFIYGLAEFVLLILMYFPPLQKHLLSFASIASIPGTLAFFTFPLTVILALPKKTRYFASSMFLLQFFIHLGAATLTSALLLYSQFGFLATCVGAFLAGVGVIPLCLIALIAGHKWTYLTTVGLSLLAVAISAALYTWVKSKSRFPND